MTGQPVTAPAKCQLKVLSQNVEPRAEKVARSQGSSRTACESQLFWWQLAKPPPPQLRDVRLWASLVSYVTCEVEVEPQGKVRCALENIRTGMEETPISLLKAK